MYTKQDACGLREDDTPIDASQNMLGDAPWNNDHHFKPHLGKLPLPAATRLQDVLNPSPQLELPANQEHRIRNGVCFVLHIQVKCGFRTADKGRNNYVMTE
jgi:hypothetical protein